MGVGAGAAAAIGAGISGTMGLAGSLLGGSAASSAASKAADAEKQMYYQTRSDLQPYTTAGNTATTQMTNLLGLNGQDAANAAMSTYQTSPGYQWQMSEGLRGVDAGAASKGMLRSGATLKAEDTYAQGLANSDFSNYYNRLSGLASTGENAAAQQATSNTSTGNSLANIYTGSGSQQASTYSNLASGLSSTVNSLFSNKDFQNWLTGSSGSGSGAIYNYVSPQSGQ